MQIYRYRTDGDRYKRLRIINEKRMMFSYEFDGRSIAQHWLPIEVEIEKGKINADFYNLNFVPVLNQRALEVFQSNLGAHVEVLPLEVRGAEEKLFLLNVRDILDCLDRSRTISKTGNDNSPLWVTTYRFRSDCIGKRLLFRLPDTWKSETLITESFFRVAVENKLYGLVINQSTLLDTVV